MKNNIVKKFFANFEEIFSALFIAITTILVLVNVFTRYFLKTGIFWSEEVATGCFVWSVFLGAAAGYKRKMHVSVDVLISHLHGKLEKIVKCVIDCILLFICAYITWMAVRYTSISYTKPTPVLGVSSVCISSSILVSFVLMTIYSVRFLVIDLFNFSKKEESK